IAYVFKISYQYDKVYLVFLIPQIIINSVSPFVIVVFPKLIIDSITEKVSLNYIITLAITMFAIRLFLSIIAHVSSNMCDRRIINIRTKMRIVLNQKSMLVTYEDLERPSYLDMKSRASQCIDNNYDIAGIANSITTFISNVLTLVGLIYIISKLHFLMVVLVILVVGINAYAKSKQARKTHFFRNKFSRIARKLFYVIGVTWDYKFTKDIKTYNLRDWLNEKKQDYLTQTSNNSIKIFMLSTFISLLSLLTSSIQQLIIYTYLVINVLNNSISIGDFSMFLSAVNSFSNSLASIMSAYISISESSFYLFDYIAFCNLETIYDTDKMNAKIDRNGVVIEFCDVSFSYPGQEQLVLKNVSIKIAQNEKLSIVGENGAGKSTFVKLLMRLYKPTEGKILLNGVDIQNIDICSYTNLISAVFQDYKILAFSLKENIATCNYNDDNICDVLKKVGLNEKVKQLVNGIETNLSKEFDLDGTEFSGGEQQKVALAQAFYKNTPIVILDEPTSNLSPIAEYDLYRRFNDLVEDKMALFISHRLSSCRFSNHIAVFDNGKIIEYGTHEELLKQRGVYSDMFSTQSQYYKNISY
ncbi:MAG: ABC transporter ATP-binding protein, partial [Clostridia bacterium]